jgi:hypothetical protein
MSARDELRRQRRKARVSKAAIQVADNALADLHKVLDESKSDDNDESTKNNIIQNRKVLEKENLKILKIEEASLGINVPVGISKKITITPVGSPREHLEKKASIRFSTKGAEYQLKENTQNLTSFTSTKSKSSKQPQVKAKAENLLGFSPWSNKMNNESDESATKPIQIKQFKQKRRKSKRLKKSTRKTTSSAPQSNTANTANTANTTNTTNTANITNNTNNTNTNTNTNTSSSHPPQLLATEAKAITKSTATTQRKLFNSDPWSQFSKPKKYNKEQAVSRWRAKASSNQLYDSNDGPILIVRVICAEDVLALDRLSGKSDPVAFVFCGKESRLSQIMIGTCNPYWNAEFCFKNTTQNIEHIDELYIQIKDDDGVSKQASSVCGRTTRNNGNTAKMKRLYDNLGGITINLKDIRDSKTKWSKPKWYTLQPLKGMTIVRGRVRVSLRYIGLNVKEGKEGEEMDKTICNGDDNVENDDEEERLMRGQYMVGDQSAPPSTFEVEGKQQQRRAAPQYLEKRVEQLSSFRSKTRAELKLMAEKLKIQSIELEKAKIIAEKAQKNAYEHKQKCDDKGAKIQELAHTIETIQRDAALSTTIAASKKDGFKYHKVRFEDAVNRDKARNNINNTGNNSSNNIDTLQFEDQHEFTLSIANAMNRLREVSTRSSGHSELRHIANDLTPAKSRVLWRCLRSGENDGDVNYQRESASVFGTFAERAPRACSATLATAMEGIARRIISGGNDGSKNNALIQSVGIFALNVFPVTLAGKVQPTLLPVIRPFCDLIRRYPHALAGAVAVRCVSITNSFYFFYYFIIFNFLPLPSLLTLVIINHSRLVK